MSVLSAGFLSGVLFFCFISPSVGFSLDQLTEIDLVDGDEESDARLFFANYTSSLLAVNTTILLYALAGAAVVGAVLLALYMLANAPSRSGNYGYGYSDDYESGSARGFRAHSSGYDILTLISVASDLYGKISYGDVDCQKKIICEFMDKPEMFGNGASQVKSGVQYATSWLAPLGFSIVDQISDAAMVDEQGGRNCNERFEQCKDISLTKTVAEKSEEVRAVKKDLTRKETEDKVKEEAETEYEYYYEDEEEEKTK